MMSQRSVGLVIEGNATSSVVLRLPSMAEELGPIKAGMPRSARRSSNFLRAGYPVANYEDLQGTSMILLRLPDEALRRVVGELCASDLVFKNLSFVLCESCLSSTELAELNRRGAWTATVMPVETPRKTWFVVEGQLTAVRHVRRLLQRNNARVFELRPGTKPLYFAAQLLAGAAPLRLLAAAQQALRTSGISGNHLYDLLEEMVVEMFRNFSNGARGSRAWTKNGCLPETGKEYMKDLRTHHPQIAGVLDEEITHAARGESATLDLPEPEI